MPSIPHGWPAGLLTYAAPMLAVLVATVGAGLCGAKGRRGLLPVVGTVAALVGWAVLLPSTGWWRAVSAPRSGSELLLAPAAVATGSWLLAWWRERWANWAAFAATAFAGWWLAGSPAGRGEFWRVWVAVGLLAWLLAKLVAREPSRALAACVTLWAGLVLTGGAASWVVATSVGVAASAGLLVGGAGAALPATVLASLIAAIDLGSGRLVRAALNASDIVCLAACGAPFLSGMVAGRMKRLGAAGPATAALVAGMLGACAAWVAHRVLRS